MKRFNNILVRIILYLIVLAGGTYALFFILEIAAIPIPSAQTYLSCPEGTTIKYTWVKETWNQPGETTMEKACITDNGKDQTAFSDEVYNQRRYNLLMPISFFSTLVVEIAWVLAAYARQRGAAQKETIS